MQIRNSIFLVTGGASGLGAATAQMAAANGAKVVIADLQAEAGEKLAKEIGGKYCKCDVTSEADGKAAVEAAVKGFGGLQVLVNCAGHRRSRAHHRQGGAARSRALHQGHRINLIGTFNMIRLAADAMAKAGPNAAGERGVIINTASVAAYDGQIGQAAYFRVERRRGRHDAADREGSLAQRHPRGHHRAGAFPDADAARPAEGSAGFSRQAGAVPLAPGQAGRICAAGEVHQSRTRC
jgi:nucleoside-diphosphate-sugar epimerase